MGEGSACIQFDHRAQDGSTDYYDGGYYCDDPAALTLDVIKNADYEWDFYYSMSSDASSMLIFFGANNPGEGGDYYGDEDEGVVCTPSHESMHTIVVSGHMAEGWDGTYCRMEDWNGFPHFAKDQEHHWYYFELPGSYYCW